MPYSVVRFNCIQPGLDPAEMAARYQAFVDMAGYADEHGLQAISLEEHHGAVNGWSPSPLVMAGLVFGRTKRIMATLNALLAPLHDPLRLAEDIAVLDLASGGRFVVTAGIGYRESEYAAHGKDWAKRGALQDEAIDTMLKAWTGEPFEYRGRRVRVTPQPSTPGGPPLILGGSSGAAAKRAVRLGMDYFPLNREAYEVYQEERVRTGLPRAKEYSRGGPHMMHVAEDVERAWTVLAPHVVAEATNYVHWSSTDTPTSGPLGTKVPSLEDLRAGGRYLVVTPDEAIEIVRSFSPDTILTLHPLVAGLDPDVGWESLRLFAERVLPTIRKLTPVS
jgi:alkanesulfonate monooxygenase SsuD/methylene tetrahydromethanopterin reductase-like flavin-dependent oxidoreductase (luciferase family)